MPEAGDTIDALEGDLPVLGGDAVGGVGEVEGPSERQTMSLGLFRRLPYQVSAIVSTP